MENWKDIEEDWASKVGFVFLFLMDWQALMFNVMLEFIYILDQRHIYLLWA
jgi:hypothetical protein